MASKKDFKAKVFKLEDLLAGKVRVPGSRNEGHEAARIREYAEKRLLEADDDSCIFLSHLVKEYFGEFTRKHYGFAREVFKRQIGKVELMMIDINGRERAILFLKKNKKKVLEALAKARK